MGDEETGRRGEVGSLKSLTLRRIAAPSPRLPVSSSPDYFQMDDDFLELSTRAARKRRVDE
jgi:hypothetical protein